MVNQLKRLKSKKALKIKMVRKELMSVRERYFSKYDLKGFCWRSADLTLEWNINRGKQNEIMGKPINCVFYKNKYLDYPDIWDQS